MAYCAPARTLSQQLFADASAPPRAMAPPRRLPFKTQRRSMPGVVFARQLPNADENVRAVAGEESNCPGETRALSPFPMVRRESISMLSAMTLATGARRAAWAKRPRSPCRRSRMPSSNRRDRPRRRAARPRTSGKDESK
eukprot:7968808-Pyramimonas_sp.AAC.1